MHTNIPYLIHFVVGSGGGQYRTPVLKINRAYCNVWFFTCPSIPASWKSTCYRISHHASFILWNSAKSSFTDSPSTFGRTSHHASFILRNPCCQVAFRRLPSSISPPAKLYFADRQLYKRGSFPRSETLFFPSSRSNHSFLSLSLVSFLLPYDFRWFLSLTVIIS